MELTIAKLTAAHDVAAFDCGREALNTFLIKHALPNQAMQGAQTYVALEDGRTVVGYYSLAVGQVAHEGAPERLAKGLARHTVPVMMLARLATSRAGHGQGIGSGLLKDAMLRTLRAADIAGIRAIVVHAKDQAARSFHQHFGFTPWVDNPLQLYLLIKDVRAVVAPLMPALLR